jgi:hypothetical protein
MNGSSRDVRGYAPEYDAEPVRLLAGGGSVYERRLLESAELDVMPDATPERLARALAPGMAAAAGIAVGVSAARGLGERAGLTRWGSRRWVRLGGLGGLGVIAALLAGSPSAPSPGVPPPDAAAPEPVRAAPAVEPEREAKPASLPASTPPAPPAVPTARELEAAPLERLRSGRSRAVTAAPAAPRRQASQSTPTADGLLEEVRLLERVRSALRAGKLDTARGLLEEYRARFARGELVFEAHLLDAERASAAGDGARARLLARELLVRPGAARYRPRLERLLRTEPTREHAEGSVRRGADMDARRSNP